MDINKDTVQQALLDAEEKVMDYANDYPRSIADYRRGNVVRACVCLILISAVLVYFVQSLSDNATYYLSLICAPALIVAVFFCNPSRDNNGTGKAKKEGKVWVSVYEQAERAVSGLSQYSGYSDIDDYISKLSARLSEIKGEKELWEAESKKTRIIIYIGAVLLFVVILFVLAAIY